MRAPRKRATAAARHAGLGAEGASTFVAEVVSLVSPVWLRAGPRQRPAGRRCAARRRRAAQLAGVTGWESVAAAGLLRRASRRGAKQAGPVSAAGLVAAVEAASVEAP
ncbi:MULTISPECIES: hypothetical protein [Rhodococcus]|uniref:hypothetical protein n=1 Tax=Rhodococcus TaxID=1827 RepID=UPI0012E900C9|nr:MULTISPECIES: hypothetical protein [Rhodococcus]MCE4165069.1 hypothetical protein [Rhodococcus sp. Ni2]